MQAETALSQVDTEVSVDKARGEKYKARPKKDKIRKQVRSSNAKRKANAMAAAWREHPFVHGHHARATLGPASASHSNRE